MATEVLFQVALLLARLQFAKEIEDFLSNSLAPALLILPTHTRACQSLFCPSHPQNPCAGNRTSTRAQVDSLGVVNKGQPGASPDANVVGDGPVTPTNAGGAIVRGYADSAYRPDFSSTREPQNPGPPAQNVRLELQSRGTASRYGVTRGQVQGSAEVGGHTRVGAGGEGPTKLARQLQGTGGQNVRWLIVRGSRKISSRRVQI
jgi:hypothetical protein